MSPAEAERIFREEQQRQAAEAQQLLAQQAAAYQAQQVAGTAVPRNAEGFASLIMLRAAGYCTQVRYASGLMQRGTITTSARELASHPRTRPFAQVPRLRRPWLQVLIDNQHRADEPPYPNEQR